MSTESFRQEVEKKERFEFGQNWANFLKKLNPERIKIAEKSLSEMLDLKDLVGKSFLDVGSGSGLFSLAAKNKGALVTSFDFDEKSVWCTQKLKSKFHANNEDWNICQGSVLDKEFLASLGNYDIVYSWGVLHHTGQMWVGIENSLGLVKKNGIYFIAIYNDQGFKSHVWWLIKYLYNKTPRVLKGAFAYILGFTVKTLLFFKYTIKLQPMAVIKPMFDYKQEKRGMSLLSNMVDWYGGFPYEFANYKYLVDFIENRGFKLIKGKQASSAGCHELIFFKA